MAAKVQTKLEKLTARAGIFCAESYFRGFQLDKLINEVLGVRSKAHNGFLWDEVIIGRAIKELATDNINYTAKSSGKSYAFNANPKLNGLLLESAIRVGLLKLGQMVDVDFDHVFTPCDKADAKYSYKQAYGYFPGVYSIDGVIAYMENRDGNTPVKFQQAETHKRAFSLFRQKGLSVRQFRADCGSYAEDIVQRSMTTAYSSTCARPTARACMHRYSASRSGSLRKSTSRSVRWHPSCSHNSSKTDTTDSSSSAPKLRMTRRCRTSSAGSTSTAASLPTTGSARNRKSSYSTTSAGQGRGTSTR